MNFDFKDTRKVLRLEDIYKDQTYYRRERGFKEFFTALGSSLLVIGFLYFILHY